MIQEQPVIPSTKQNPMEYSKHKYERAIKKHLFSFRINIGAIRQNKHEMKTMDRILDKEKDENWKSRLFKIPNKIS
eukprot:UN05668